MSPKPRTTVRVYRDRALSESESPQLLTARSSAPSVTALAMPAMSTPDASTVKPVAIRPSKPRVGEVFLADVSLRGAMNEIARDLATAKNIDVSLPYPRPPPGANPRPCLYIGPVLGGHAAFPLATFDGKPPETWDLLLREVVVPIGDESTVLPFFEGRARFQTKPRWKHSDGRPSYIVPSRVVIPDGTAMESTYRFLAGRTVARLVVCCRGVVDDLKNLSQEDAESLLDSYMTVVYGRSLYPAPEDVQDMEDATHADEGAPSPVDDNVSPTSEAHSIPPSNLSSSLNPRAAPFVSTIHSRATGSSGNLAFRNLFDDMVSRLSLASGASSVAQPSILAVLQASSATDGAAPQRKLRLAGAVDKENRAP